MAGREQVEKKRPVVLAAGVFDLLHLGHVKFLEEAKKAGGKEAELIVIVARDKTVEQRKGEKTIMSENQRRALVESLKVVDEAILGFEDFNIGDVIRKIKPDVIALGHDQANIGETVKKAISEMGLNIKVVRIGKFGEDELNSSSEIKRKIIELYRRHS
jgi:FAD synthetase